MGRWGWFGTGLSGLESAGLIFGSYVYVDVDVDVDVHSENVVGSVGRLRIPFMDTKFSADKTNSIRVILCFPTTPGYSTTSIDVHYRHALY